MGHEQIHDYYLDELVSNLSIIHEDKKKVKWIMKDGKWYRPNSYAQNKLCDLLLVYYDDHGIPVELKGNRNKKSKAKVQLEYGRDFMENELGLYVPYGKFVVYERTGYKYEKIEYKKGDIK